MFAGGFTPPGSAVPAGWPGNQNNGFFSKYTDKYFFNSGIVIPGTELSLNRENLGGAGNYVIGILAGGDSPAYNEDGSFVNGNSINTNHTDKYTYATDVCAAGTTLGTGRNLLAGTGTAFVGIFAAGANNSHVVIATTEKYTYGTDTVAYGGNLGLARRWLAASSNPVTGIYAGGFVNDGTTYVDLYTFSTDTAAAGTVLAQAWFARTGTGNFETALIGGGYKAGSVVNDVDKYSYANSSWTSGTDLGVARNQFSASSDPTTAIFAGGVDTVTPIYGTNYTDVYLYANDAVSPGTVLGLGRYCLCSVSTSPSGL